MEKRTNALLLRLLLENELAGTFIIICFANDVGGGHGQLASTVVTVANYCCTFLVSSSNLVPSRKEMFSSPPPSSSLAVSFWRTGPAARRGVQQLSQGRLGPCPPSSGMGGVVTAFDSQCPRKRRRCWLLNRLWCVEQRTTATIQQLELRSDPKCSHSQQLLMTGVLCSNFDCGKQEVYEIEERD